MRTSSNTIYLQTASASRVITDLGTPGIASRAQFGLLIVLHPQLTLSILVFLPCRYITDVFDTEPNTLPPIKPKGKASVVPAWRHIRHNFIMSVYSSQEAIDTDDGSAYYQTYENFFAFAANGFQKNTTALSSSLANFSIPFCPFRSEV